MSHLENFLKDTIQSMNAVRMAEITGDMSHLKKIGAIKREFQTSASIAPKVGASVTEYSIKGDLPNVLKAIEALYDQYHPAGYDTTVHSIRYDGEQYIARMSRLNSCE